MKKQQQIIQRITTRITDPEFQARHKVNTADFTRQRALPFVIVLTMLLQKSVKSLQVMANEFFEKLALLGMFTVFTVTNSAFSQARQKMKHTAFLELLHTAIIPAYYAQDGYQTWQGFRLVAIDGSKVRLPNTQAIRDDFGTIAVSNQHDPHLGEHPWALASVCYDLLNEIPLDAIFAKGKAYEVDLAVSHLDHLTFTDLLLCDMNYPSYRFLAELVLRTISFTIRCSKASFAPARRLFTGDGPDSVVVALTPHHEKRADIQQRGLPTTITVRFVRVMLDDGTIEVLVTSLLDEQVYPVSVFQSLYHLRWGVETLYDRIKNHLTLENFSGLTVEAVKQDFYAIIFLCGLEAVLIEDAEAILDQKSADNRYAQQVNRMVSLNTLKNHVIALFLTDASVPDVCEKLTRLFLTNPVCVRPDRQVPRNKVSPRASLHHQKRRRKICFSPSSMT